jgi:hypothetical protein
MGLSPQEMNDAIVRNLKDKTGKTLEQWLETVQESSLGDKKEIVPFLKEVHGLGHFQAQTIFKYFKTSENA